MKPKNYLTIYAIATLSLVALFVLFNGIVDPLQFYRKAFYKPVFLENQRYQNPGLIKNYPYDTIILGTSHTENFLPSEIEAQYGFKTLKLSMHGSSAYEQALTLEKALKTGNVKQVIWGIEYNAFSGDINRVRADKAGGEFPFYLYEEKWYSHIRYLVSWDTFIYAINALRTKGHTNLETLNTWFLDYEFNQQKVLSVWEKARQHPPNPDESQTYEIDQNIQQHLVHFIKQYPHVQFYVFFPPYSILAHVYDYKYSPTRFTNRMHYKNNVEQALITFENCHLYDFQIQTEITHNLNNYTDLTHYSKTVSDFILSSLFSKNHKITRKNYGINQSLLLAQIEMFMGNDFQTQLQIQTTQNIQ